jgi:hypothetical protein
LKKIEKHQVYSYFDEANLQVLVSSNPVHDLNDSASCGLTKSIYSSKPTGEIH